MAHQGRASSMDFSEDVHGEHRTSFDTSADNSDSSEDTRSDMSVDHRNNNGGDNDNKPGPSKPTPNICDCGKDLSGEVS